VDSGTRLRHFSRSRAEKKYPDTGPLAKLYYEGANIELGALLGELVEDGGIGVAPLSLEPAQTTGICILKDKLLTERRCMHFAKENKKPSRRWAWQLSYFSPLSKEPSLSQARQSMHKNSATV
jgi:hypothetical protein